MQDSIGSRMGEGQRGGEVLETTLLNRLVAERFAQIGTLRHEGDFYMVDVLTPQGEPATIRIDPRTGQMTRIR